MACLQVSHEPGREVARKTAAIKLVQSNSCSSVLSNTISCNFAGAVTAGNLLLAAESATNASTTVTLQAGWTTAASTFGSSLGQVVFYKFASGSETTVTFQGGGLLPSRVLQIFEFSGIDPTVTPPSTNSKSGAFSGTYDFPSVTTTANGALVFSAGVSSGLMLLVPNFDGWTNGFTEAYDFTLLALNSVVSAYGYVGAAGSWNTSATSNTSGTMLSLTVSFQRRPGIVTNLAVSASANKNVVMFTPPSAPVSHIILLARTGDCTFTAANPTGSEALGASVGGGTVVFNNAPTANLSATPVTVGGTSTTVSYNAATNALTHSSLVASTLYCYKAYARNGTSLDDADPARPTRSGTPTSGGASNPIFVYNAGSTSLSAPSVLPGVGAFFADNSGKLTSVDKTGLRRFAPYTLPNAVQNRAPAGTLSGDSDATVFVSSLSGDAYALWGSGANQGKLRWSTEPIDGEILTGTDEPLGAALYASPLVSSTLGRVFVATRNAALVQNRVYALNAATGACLWVFNGTCAGASTLLGLGQISASGVVDPATSRLFFASTSLLGSTIWAVDVRDAASGDRRLWSRNIGDSDSSITFSSAARSSILVGTNTGRIHHLEPAGGTSCWGSTSDGCPGTMAGTEQFFCADATGARTSNGLTCLGGPAIQKGIAVLNGAYGGSVLFRTADGNVWRMSLAGVRLWKTSLSGASSPTPASELGSGVAYVGGNDGVIRELSLATGNINSTRSVGGAAIVVGDATYDSTDAMLYVNTSQGALYAFSVPF